MGEKRKSLDEFTEKGLHYPKVAMEPGTNFWLAQEAY
jgi:hypothetical protein